MITAKGGGEGRFVARLADRARQLGEARAETRLRQGREDPRRWRLARLLWPLIAREP